MTTEKNPVGRPPLPQIRERTTIYINTEKIYSIKYIALRKDKTQTDIIDEALTDYIKKWEQKNGAIPER